jgi:hypothetical protein
MGLQGKKAIETMYEMARERGIIDHRVAVEVI